MARLIFGSGRFSSLVCNNINEAVVGCYDIPTKLVDEHKDVFLCLPQEIDRWGMYPTHQESWITLPFVVACHARHCDLVGLEVRKEAWKKISGLQWQVLVVKAVEFVSEFRARLEIGDLCDRKVYKSLTRALQDCILYLADRETFPTDQDAFLAESLVVDMIKTANRGRAGELSVAEGLALVDQVEEILSTLIEANGGLEACKTALATLQADQAPGRVILLPAGVSLTEGAGLVSYDIVIGVPDQHDLDAVTIVNGQVEPHLVQLHDELSGQRLDLMAVSAELGPCDQLAGGHPSFQSVTEMILANGTPVSEAGRQLVKKLSNLVNPLVLASKYREVARDFFYGNNRKSWLSRENDPSLDQIKKAIPLYRIACDLLPRATFMERNGSFPGGCNIAELAKEAGLEYEFLTIRSFLDSQKAPQEELEKIAVAIERRL